MATTKVNTNQVTDPLFNSSMARQAIINGNFDVWQRGTTVTNPVTSSFIADRHRIDFSLDGGTNPTLTHSRQLLTSGDIPNAFYYYNIATNGAGSSYGNSSFYYVGQFIENGTRFLCGNGKKVTLSFWAKSDIANKKIGLGLAHNYGTGGSPSAEERIKGGTITLTSSWTKYTVTFTTNTLAGKTFGTDNNDYLLPFFFLQWGTTIGNTFIQTSVAAESFVGSGNICIAQVQLCAGDVALPFMPKSYDEELRACQRYCQTFVSDGIYTNFSNGFATSTTNINTILFLGTPMRIQPTLTATAGDYQVYDGVGLIDVTALAIDTGQSSKNIVCLTATVASGATQYRGYRLVSDGIAGRTLILSAEL